MFENFEENHVNFREWLRTEEGHKAIKDCFAVRSVANYTEPFANCGNKNFKIVNGEFIVKEY